jgi:hypothetical protein
VAVPLRQERQRRGHRDHAMSQSTGQSGDLACSGIGVGEGTDGDAT